LFVGIIGILSLQSAVAEPTGPSSIDPIGSSRFPVTSASNISAIAGNVSELNFESNSITNTWQGYFGNISGSILLGDANNNTLYNWTSASPNGEIYATRSSTAPSWATIGCADETELNTEDTDLGVNSTVDQDAVNRTFLNTTAFSAFYVGNVNINSTQDCRATHLNDENGAPSSAFAEVLLSDTTNLIYTGLITTPTVGFDNRTHQFQMLVGENGHSDNTDVTPYYFYLELH